MTLADMPDKLERRRIGHREAMRWLGVDNYNELAAFRYATDRQTGALIPLEFGRIDLVNLHDVMNGIANFFECAALDFTYRRDTAMEAVSASPASGTSSAVERGAPDRRP